MDNTLLLILVIIMAAVLVQTALQVFVYFKSEIAEDQAKRAAYSIINCEVYKQNGMEYLYNECLRYK
jgi:hypothetical protein